MLSVTGTMGSAGALVLAPGVQFCQVKMLLVSYRPLARARIWASRVGQGHFKIGSVPVRGP